MPRRARRKSPPGPKDTKTKSTVVATLMILEDAPTAQSGLEMEDARIPFRGDIVDVYRTRDIATRTGNDWHINGGIGTARHVFVHMRDVPTERWTNMRRQFSRRVTVPVSLEGEVYEDTIRRRRWRFRIKDLSPANRTTLLQDREVTIDWLAARQHIRKKLVQVANDAEQDDDTNPVHDDDLPPEPIVNGV